MKPISGLLEKSKMIDQSKEGREVAEKKVSREEKEKGFPERKRG